MDSSQPASTRIQSDCIVNPVQCSTAKNISVFPGIAQWRVAKVRVLEFRVAMQHHNVSLSPNIACSGPICRD